MTYCVSPLPAHVHYRCRPHPRHLSMGVRVPTAILRRIWGWCSCRQCVGHCGSRSYLVIGLVFSHSYLTQVNHDNLPASLVGVGGPVKPASSGELQPCSLHFLFTAAESLCYSMVGIVESLDLGLLHVIGDRRAVVCSIENWFTLCYSRIRNLVVYQIWPTEGYPCTNNNYADSLSWVSLNIRDNVWAKVSGLLLCLLTVCSPTRVTIVGLTAGFLYMNWNTHPSRVSFCLALRIVLSGRPSSFATVASSKSKLCRLILSK